MVTYTLLIDKPFKTRTNVVQAGSLHYICASLFAFSIRYTNDLILQMRLISRDWNYIVAYSVPQFGCYVRGLPCCVRSPAAGLHLNRQSYRHLYHASACAYTDYNVVVLL